MRNNYALFAMALLFILSATMPLASARTLTTSAWTSQSTNTLNVGVQDQSCVTANNFIYCMGGSNGNSNGYAANVVQYAQIPSGGGATYAWHTTNSLAVPTLSEGCVTANGYIYCVGGDSAAYGGSYLATVQYAKILSGGGTSTWTSQSDTLYLAGSAQSCVTENNYIYCYGSYPGVAVQYATVPSNGGPTSAWTSEYRYYPYLDTQSGASCVTANGYLYCMGDDWSLMAITYIIRQSCPIHNLC